MEIMKADKEYIALRDLPRTECPEELKHTKILTFEGFECKVFYNYVDVGEYGMRPTNHWWGMLINNDEWYWRCPLREEVKTLEKACEIILPLFKMVIKRFSQ